MKKYLLLIATLGSLVVASQSAENKQEALGIPLPADEHWKVADRVQEKNVIQSTLIPGNETLQNWSKKLVRGSQGGLYQYELEDIMKAVFDDYKKGNPVSTLKMIEKDEAHDFPWIIFSISSLDVDKRSKNESQLWFIIKSYHSVYTNHLSVHAPFVSGDLKKEWIEIFKGSQFSNLSEKGSGTQKKESPTGDAYAEGFKKLKGNDYKGAIDDFNRAIKANPANEMAYHNRGFCKQELGNAAGAIEDYSKAIDLSPEFMEPLYGRAAIYNLQENYEAAFKDVDKVIQINSKFPNALMMRGQLFLKKNNKNGACTDFYFAKQNGDPLGEVFCSIHCSGFAEPGGYIKFELPAFPPWTLIDNNEKPKNEIQYGLKSEGDYNRSEWLNQSTTPGITALDMEGFMKYYFESEKKNTPALKLTMLEKDEKAKYPWILFMFESADASGSKEHPSRIWHVMQGNNTIYMSSWSVRKGAISNEQKNKWIGIFKKCVIVH